MTWRDQMAAGQMFVFLTADELDTMTDEEVEELNAYHTRKRLDARREVLEEPMDVRRPQ